jgi:hypothetical protein
MHTAEQLARAMFEVRVDGVPAGPDDVFPGWHAHDRLGVIVNEPLGAVGASHLIQLSITCFYDHRPARRGPEDVIYPEIYAFHIGGPHGDHSPFDFWPERKEVFLGEDPCDVLDAINDKAITRLVVVDGPRRPVVHRSKERPTAIDRIASAFAYSASGSVDDADLEITGATRATEANPRNALDPSHLMKQHIANAKPGAKESDPAYGMRLHARQFEVTEQDRATARQRRRELLSDGTATESYRRLDVNTALDMLVPARA